MQCIYGLKTKHNGKFYVGRTNNLKHRWGVHVSYFRHNKHSNTHMQATWNRYGPENFELIILEMISDNQLLTVREQYWIDHYKSQDPEFGYNMMPATSGSISPRYFSPEHRRKIGDAKRGQKQSPETIEKMRIASTGRKWTPGQHEKLDGRFKGEANGFSKLTWDIVNQVRGKALTEYKSQIDFANEFGVDASLISLLLLNKIWVSDSFDPSLVKRLPKKVYKKTTQEHGGVHNPNAKFTEEQIRTIRERVSSGEITRTRLSKELGVSDVCICDIVNRKTYQNVL